MKRKRLKMEVQLKGTRKFRKDGIEESRLKEKLVQEGKSQPSGYTKSEVEMPERTYVEETPVVWS